MENNKKTTETIGHLISRVNNAQIYLGKNTRNQKGNSEFDGYAIEKQISTRLFLEKLLDEYRKLDLGRKTKDTISDMLRKEKEQGNHTSSLLETKLHNKKALSHNASKYFKFDDKYAILNFLRQRKMFHDKSHIGDSKDKQLEDMVKMDRYWPVEKEKVFETLDTKGNTYQLIGDNDYGNLIRACIMNTEHNLRQKMNFERKN